MKKILIKSTVLLDRIIDRCEQARDSINDFIREVEYVQRKLGIIPYTIEDWRRDRGNFILWSRVINDHRLDAFIYEMAGMEMIPNRLGMTGKPMRVGKLDKAVKDIAKVNILHFHSSVRPIPLSQEKLFKSQTEFLAEIDDAQKTDRGSIEE